MPVAAKDGFPEVCAFWAPELMHLVVRACGPLHSAAHLASSTPLCDARICPDFAPDSVCRALEHELQCAEVMARASMVIALLALHAAIPGQAQAASDPWLPGSWKFSASIATGVPFLVMSEVALGITDHAAIGVLGGTTPIVSGFGVRPRAAVPCTSTLRLLASAPLIYYPPHADGPAWWLARPSMELDWHATRAFSLAGGAGVVGVATEPVLFGSEEQAAASAYGRELQNRRTALWWTLNALVSAEVSTKTWLFADLTAVFEHGRLAGSDWIGGPPFIAFFGLGTRL